MRTAALVARRTKAMPMSVIDQAAVVKQADEAKLCNGYAVGLPFGFIK